MFLLIGYLKKGQLFMFFHRVTLFFHSDTRRCYTSNFVGNSSANKKKIPPLQPKRANENIMQIRWHNFIPNDSHSRAYWMKLVLPLLLPSSLAFCHYQKVKFCQPPFTQLAVTHSLTQSPVTEGGTERKMPPPCHKDPTEIAQVGSQVGRNIISIGKWVDPLSSL